jgi:hypothetical protein
LPTPTKSFTSRAAGHEEQEGYTSRGERQTMQWCTAQTCCGRTTDITEHRATCHVREQKPQVVQDLGLGQD